MNFMQKLRLRRKLRALREAQTILNELDGEVYFLSKQLEDEFKDIQEAIEAYCRER